MACLWSLCRKLTVNTSGPSTTYHMHFWRKLFHRVRAEGNVWLMMKEHNGIRSLLSLPVSVRTVQYLLKQTQNMNQFTSRTTLLTVSSVPLIPYEKQPLTIQTYRKLQFLEQCFLEWVRPTTSEQEKALLTSWSKNQCCLLLSKNSCSPALQNSLKCLYSSGLIRRTTCKSGSSFRVWNVTALMFLKDTTSLTLKNGTKMFQHLLFMDTSEQFHRCVQI